MSATRTWDSWNTSADPTFSCQKGLLSTYLTKSLKSQPRGGPGGKLSWSSNFMAIHPVIVEIFWSGPTWWTQQPAVTQCCYPSSDAAEVSKQAIHTAITGTQWSIYVCCLWSKYWKKSVFSHNLIKIHLLYISVYCTKVQGLYCTSVGVLLLWNWVTVGIISTNMSSERPQRLKKS